MRNLASLPRLAVPAVILVSLVNAPWTSAEEPTDETNPGKSIDEIVVTGSHLSRSDYDGPQPIIIFDRAYLEATGFRDIADFGRYLPQSHQTPSEEENMYSGLAASSWFNLRGLGADSTLTLVNGLRITPYGTADAFTDISAIPMAAVERIEILKDGASAIYGADAVAGVVNIILRKDFVGTEVTAGYQLTSRGDNAQMSIDLFHGGQRGGFHYMLGMFYEDREPVYKRNRQHSADADFRPVGGYNYRSMNSAPGTFLRYDTFTIHADPACGTDPLIANVETWPQWPGESACTFNGNQFAMIFLDRQRASASLRAGYDFDNGMQLFTDVLYTRTKSRNEISPTPVSARFDTITGRPFVPADHPDNPWGVDGELWYRLVELGPRQTYSTSQQHRVTLGIEGTAGDWAWTASVLDSSSRVEHHAEHEVLLEEFQAALLGQGGPDHDQYYNPFGWMPSNDPSVIDGFTTSTTGARESSGEQAADIMASRSLWHLTTGDARIALGLQWRSKDHDEYVDELIVQGLIAGVLGWETAPVSRDIGATYAELSMPLGADVELQLAARYEHYNDFGGTTNPKIALRWQPLEQLAFRASWGTSFHAPNFNDLYQDPEETFDWFVDTPRCDATGLDEDCSEYVFDVLERGNPDLGPEIGESWYAGLVWSPLFASGLDIDVGYWRFDYEDRIQGVDGQFLLDNLPADNPYVERAPQTPDEAAAGIPGRIILIHDTPHNLAHWFSDGWDLDVGYRMQTARGNELSLRLDYTYTATWEAVLPESFGWETYSRAGGFWDGPLPRNRGNLNLGWRAGRHDLNGMIRYAGHYQNWMEFLPVDGEESDIPFIVDSFTTLDLQYALHIGERQNANLRIGCRNCTDEAPPFTHDTLGVNIHDSRGLIWYANWTQTF